MKEKKIQVNIHSKPDKTQKMGASRIESEYNEINSKNGWMMAFQVIILHFNFMGFKSIFLYHSFCWRIMQSDSEIENTEEKKM